MLNIEELKGVMAPLNKFGQDELTFSVPSDSGEIEVTLRALYPREEIAVQRFAMATLEGAVKTEGATEESTLSRATALEYMDSFRSETIARAIVQIGNTDLRNLPYIEKKDVEGRKTKIERHVALRELITENWSRSMITIAFSRYGNLVTQIAEKADKIVAESVADLDAEIERLEKRLSSVREERERRAKGDPSVTNQQIKVLLDAGRQMETDIQDAIDEVASERKAEARVREVASREVPDDLEFNDESPPPEEEGEAPVPTPPSPEPPRAKAPAPRVEPPRVQTAPRKSVVPERVPPPTQAPRSEASFRSSFEEEDHPDSQAVEDERIAAATSAARAGSRNRIQDVGDEEPISSTMGAEDLGVISGPDGQPKLGPDGQPIRVFRLPSETISPRGRGGPPEGAKAPAINKPPEGTINPRFKKPGGG